MQRRAFNWKLAVVLVAGVLGLSVGGYALHRWQLKRTAAGLRAQSERAERAGDYAGAAEKLNQYLLLMPSDISRMERYAALLEKTGGDGAESYARSVALEERILRLDPDRPELRRRLAEKRVKHGDYSDAKVHLQTLAKAAPADAALKTLLARCEEETARPREAIALYREALRLDPKSVEAHARLAGLLRRQGGEPDEADRVMDARETKNGVVASNPKSARAYLARAEYRAQFAVPGVDPAADVARALELDPADPDVQIAAARVALNAGDPATAATHLERALKIDPNRAAVYSTLADIESAAGRTDKAAAWLEQGIQALPDAQSAERSVLRWNLADLWIRAGKPEAAAPVVATLEKERVRPEAVEFLKALLPVARRQWPAAAKALAAVEPKLTASASTKGLAKRALVALGACYERLGNADLRLDAYRRAVALNPTPDPLWSAARMGLAASLMALDRFDDALDEYRQVFARDPRAGLPLARLQIARNVRKGGDQARWDDVGKTLDTLDKLPLGRAAGPEITVLRAEDLATRGELKKALALLEKEAAAHPEQTELRVALANLAGRVGRPEDTLAALEAARKHLGERPELWSARVAYWARAGGLAAPAALDALAAELEKNPGSDPSTARAELAAAYTRVGKAAQAAALLRQVAAARPEDLGVWLDLFDLALRGDDDKQAEALLDRIRRVEGEDGTFALFGRALLAIRRAQRGAKEPALLEQARADLDRVARVRPSWSRVPVALAEVDLLQGRPDAAVKDYLHAVLDLGSRNLEAIRRLSRLLTERKRYAEAERVLSRLRDEHVPMTEDTKRMAAQVAYDKQDFDRALSEAEGVVNSDSKDARDLIWLAQLRWAAGKPAEPLLRRAVALDGKDPEAWLALVIYLARTDRQAEALDTLARAEKEAAGPLAPLALARGYEAVNLPDRAEAKYKQARAARPDDPATLRAEATFFLTARRGADAEADLRKLVALGGDSPDVAWARRSLATLVALKGGRAGDRNALDILGTAAGPDPKAARPEDLRTKAEILAMKPGRARRAEAAAILEGLIGRKESRPSDVALLAQIKESEGDWPRARRLWLGVANAPKVEPRQLAACALALLRHDAAGDAAAALARLQSLAPDAPEIPLLQARLLHARGQDDRAVAALEGLVATNPKRTNAAAALLEEWGKLDEAERTLRKALGQTAAVPDAPLRLAAFLGRRGRIGDAADVLEKHAWPSIPADQVGHAAVQAAYAAGPGDGAQLERLADRVSRAVADHPGDLSLKFDLANLRSVQGRDAEAEAIFRDLYRRDGTLVATLNNLAWALALQGKERAREGLPLIDRAIELQGEAPELIDTRAMVHLALGDYGPAARDLEDVVAVQPSAEAYFHLARAYHGAGRRDDARRALREADSLGLKVKSLHPREQALYDKLRAEIAPA